MGATPIIPICLFITFQSRLVVQQAGQVPEYIIRPPLMAWLWHRKRIVRYMDDRETNNPKRFPLRMQFPSAKFAKKDYLLFF